MFLLLMNEPNLETKVAIMALISLYRSRTWKDSEDEEAVPKTEVLEQLTPMISCGPSQKIPMMTLPL